MRAGGLLDGGRTGFCHGDRQRFPACFYRLRILAMVLHHDGRKLVIIVRMLVREIVQLAGFKLRSASCSIVELTSRYMYNISLCHTEDKIGLFIFLLVLIQLRSIKLLYV